MSGIAMAAALGLTLAAADERSFFFIPGVEDFRMQAIARTEREREWPFSVESGYLLCAWVMGQKVVYFVEELPQDQRDDDVDPRIIPVAADPLALIVGSIGSRDLLAPYDSLEQLIRRIAPFERTGLRLCDQPRGSEIGPGEL